MTKRFQKPLELWKALWVVCPLTYLIAIALFALAGLIADRATGKTTVQLDGHSVEMVTGEWLRYAWYQSIAVQLIAFAHAAFCLFIVFRFRNNTKHTWFKVLALALALAYIGYVGYCAYEFFHPDPNIRPISDPL